MKPLLRILSAKRSVLISAIAAVAIISGWRLWAIANQPPHLLEIADEIGSIPDYMEGVFPNVDGSSLVYFKETETGIGTYLYDTVAGESHLLIEQQEKGYGNQCRMLGWSPDGKILAYVTIFYNNPANPKIPPTTVILFDGTSGKIEGEIPAGAYAFDSQFTWLSADSFIYSTYQHRSWLTFSRNQTGKWVESQVTKRFVIGNLNGLTVTSPHSFAWLKGNEVWSYDLASGTLKNVWGTTNELDSFAYDDRTGDFLFSCLDSIGPLLIRFRPPESWQKQGTVVDVSRTHRTSAFDLDMRHGVYKFTVQTNSGLSTFVWNGMLRYYAFAGRSLFFTGCQPDGLPCLWQYDMGSGAVSCLDSSLQHRLRYAKLVTPTSGVETNADGTELAFHLWQPAQIIPGKKYPVILGQLLHSWNPCQQIAANAGYYFAAVNFTNWINPNNSWAGQVMGLYKVLANNPSVDTNRIYLISYSAQAADVGEALDSKPDFCKGVALFHPSCFPSLSGAHLSKVLLVGGTDDRSSSAVGLIEYQNQLVASGVPVDCVVQKGVQHFNRSTASERQTALQFARFLSEK